jgi:hypothetical protein
MQLKRTLLRLRPLTGEQLIGKWLQQQRLLEHIFGVVKGAEHVVAVNDQLPLMWCHQGLERSLIARLRGKHQRGLRWKLLSDSSRS